MGHEPKGTPMIFWAVILLVITVVCVLAWRYDRKHNVRVIDGPGSSVDAEATAVHMHGVVGNSGPFPGP
jgi:hypothetical protein